MLPLGVKIIGVVVMLFINIGYQRKTSLMKAVSKVITVLLWTKLESLYIESLCEPPAFLVFFIELMTVAFLYPMLCQFE